MILNREFLLLLTVLCIGYRASAFKPIALARAPAPSRSIARSSTRYSASAGCELVVWDCDGVLVDSEAL
jgi:hypothetical protein